MIVVSQNQTNKDLFSTVLNRLVSRSDYVNLKIKAMVWEKQLQGELDS
jgi:hypothetical protein